MPKCPTSTVCCKRADPVTSAGSGFVHLDAKTPPEVEIELMDKDRASVGRLKFHLDTHGYQLERPGGPLHFQA